MIKKDFKLDTIDTVSGNYIVKFGATWCGPCRMLKPILEKVAEEIDVYDVDVDKNQEAVVKYGVRSVPTVLIVKDNQIVETILGANTTAEQFLEKIKG